MKHQRWVGRFWLGLLAFCWIGTDCSGVLHSHNPVPVALAPVSQKLIDGLNQAQRLFDTTELDLGNPLPRGTLVRGWSWNEAWQDGGSGNWAVQDEAILDFPILLQAPRRFTIWMGGPPDQGPAQEVRIQINGHGVAQFQLDAKLNRFVFPVPARYLIPGKNRLSFRFSRLSAPLDGRRLAAIVDKILIKPDSSGGWSCLRPAQVVAQDFWVHRLTQEPGQPRALQQPGDTWLEFGLLPRPGSVLRFLHQTEDEAGQTVAVASIQACIDTDVGESCRDLTRLAVRRPEPAAWVEKRVPLPELDSHPVRLRFKVEGNLASRGRGWPGHFWGEPEILSVQPPFEARPLFAGQIERPPVQTGGSGGGSPRRPIPIQHVLVYLIDTLRPDVLLNSSVDLPNIRRLLRNSLWSVEAWAPSSWTKPASATLLTSLPPSLHGATGRTSRLRPDVLTLASWLEQHGIASGAIVANGNVASEFGFGRGFRHYRHLFAGAPRVHAAALDWLQQVGDGPSFTYLHLIDPHEPYQPHDLWKRALGLDLYTGPMDGSDGMLHRLKDQEMQATESDRQHLQGLYQAEIRQLDAALGQFLEKLQASGKLETTAILLVSDHGEEFLEHGGWLHGSSLEPEQTSILLGLWLPGSSSGKLLSTPASLEDVAPTICELLGIPAAPEFQGHHITSIPPDRAPIALELTLDQLERLGRIGPDWAYNFSPGVNHQPSLYARLSDPGHRHNLAPLYPVLTEALEQFMLSLKPAPRSSQDSTPLLPHELAPETLEQLRGLGYLGP